MKVILPSLGYCGDSCIDMNQPTMATLRAVGGMNDEPELLKIQIVQTLCPNLDLSLISKYDLDYLYMVATFATTLNEVSYDVTCPKCGKKHSFRYTFGGQEITTLEKLPKEYSRTVAGVTLNFRVITAQDWQDIVLYALAADNYDEAIKDGITAKTLGISFEEVENLSIVYYIYAHLFFNMTFHGVKLYGTEKCPDCGEPLVTGISLPTSLLKVDFSTLINSYHGISDKISFEAFMQFTLPEYIKFIDSLGDGRK